MRTFNEVAKEVEFKKRRAELKEELRRDTEALKNMEKGRIKGLFTKEQVQAALEHNRQLFKAYLEFVA